MNTLTVPKIKDLVNKPSEQYKDIFYTLQNVNKTIDKSNVSEDSSAMTDELTQFFNDLKKTSTLNNTLNTNSTVSEPLGESLTSNNNSNNSNTTYSPF